MSDPDSAASPPPKGGVGGDRPIVLAVVSGAHGIAGEVRLKLFGDDIAGVKAHRLYNDGALTLLAVRAGGQGAIARFAEIADRTAAEGLRGTMLSVPRSALPPLGEGEYYHADVIGLPVVDGEDSLIGQVVAIENFGAGDVIEVEQADGKRAMMPFREPAARLESERVVADPSYLV